MEVESPIMLYTFFYSTYDFQRVTLEALGFRPDQIIDAKESSLGKDFTASVIVSCAKDYRKFVKITRQAYRNIRDDFVHLASEETGPKRVYISRADSRYQEEAKRTVVKRVILNEVDVYDKFLRNYGFEKILMSELSFRKQIALFKEAEIVVSPHGAALIHCCFCGESTKVVELAFPEYCPIYFKDICQEFGIEYYSLVEGNECTEEMQNFTIDMTNFKTFMTRLLKENRPRV